MSGGEDLPPVENDPEDVEEAPVLADPAEAEAESEAPAEGIGGAGAAVIRRLLKSAPNAPGVYRMIAANGDVLYVGKARNIRARVASYVRGQAHTTASPA